MSTLIGVIGVLLWIGFQAALLLPADDTTPYDNEDDQW